MTFNNLGLRHPLPELKLFPLHIVGHALSNNFSLSNNRYDLKVVLYHIDFCLVDCHDCNFLGFVFLGSSCAGLMASNPVPYLLVLIFS